MTIADERLALIRTKVERAKEHLRNVETEIRAFLVTNPYAVNTQRDPQTRQLIYYVDSVQETPIHIPVIVSDVLHSLRSALDHMAYQLVIAGGATPTKQTYFPISDDAAKYKSEAPGKVRGMSQTAIKAIDAIKPYQGGDDSLWRLHRLNNIDKHRTLITVGSALRGVNISPHLGRLVGEMFASIPEFAGREVPILPDILLKPADRLFPLKAGDKLFEDAPDAEVNEKMQFAFEVAFGEPGVVEGEALVETLTGMADRVDDLLINFKPMLS